MGQMAGEPGSRPIGPTVCELDGPIPIENRSKTETATAINSQQLGLRSDVDAGGPWRRLGLR
jgi:hypothetical protein